MKKLRSLFRKIPRKVKIILNCVLILILAFWIWLLLGSPSGIEATYRRTEKANLIGPGEIITVLKNPGYNYEYLILGQDGNYATGYFHDKEDSRRTQFILRERTDGIALLTFPADNMPWSIQMPVPVFLFDCHEHAVRAELFLSLPDGSGETGTMHAQREHDGYFCFFIDPLLAETEVVNRLRLLSGNTMADRSKFSLHAQIRLFDEADTLLTETSLTIE